MDTIPLFMLEDERRRNESLARYNRKMHAERDEARAIARRMYRRALGAEAALAALDKRCAELERDNSRLVDAYDILKAWKGRP